METATAPGLQTTEYKVSKWTLILSGLASVVGYISSILDILPASSKWLAPVTAIVGALAALLTALGYQVTRASVKKAALSAAAQMQPLSTPEAAAENIGKTGP